MKAFISCVLTFLFSGFALWGQSEVKVYAGILDYPGLAFEKGIGKGTSVEVGLSFRTRTDQVLFIDNIGADMTHCNGFVNLAIKWYREGKKEEERFFWGLYLKYWLEGQRISNIQSMTQAQVELAKNNELIVLRNNHKISLGGLTGYRFFIGERFCVTPTVGIGLSPKFAYWKEIEAFEGSKKSERMGSNEFIGNLNHLSGIAQVSLGYRFGGR